MRKYIAICMALCMMLMCTSAFAATVPESQSVSVSMEYGVAMSYTVTIPERLQFTDEEMTITCAASNVVIPEGASLGVCISSAGSSFDGRCYWLTSPTSGKKLPYHIFLNPDEINYYDLSIPPGNSIAWFTESGTASVIARLLRLPDRKYADIFTDNITFDVGIAQYHFGNLGFRDCYVCHAWDTGNSDYCALCQVCAHCVELFCWTCGICMDCHDAQGYVCEATVECDICHRYLPPKYCCPDTEITGSYGICMLCCTDHTHYSDTLPEMFIWNEFGRKTYIYTPQGTTWKSFIDSKWNKYDFSYALGGITQGSSWPIRTENFEYLIQTDIIKPITYQPAYD